MIGTVKRISQANYGFIECDDGSGTVFFPFRDFERVNLDPPKVGDVITFDPVETPRGRKVSNLRVEDV
jgi:cold shock CspA family protein